MPKINSNTLKLRSDVRYRIVGGEAVIIRQETAQAIVLNGVGALIIKMIDSQSTISQLLQVLEKKYGSGQFDFAHDLKMFLNDLLRNGVVEEFAYEEE